MCFTRFHALHAFAPYVPLSPLTHLRVFAPYVPYLRALPGRLVRLLYSPCAAYLRVYLSYLRTLKSFQDGFVILQKNLIFQRLLKTLPTVRLLCGSKKKLFTWENFLSIFKRWNQFNVFCFSFHLFNHKVINFLVWNNKKSEKIHV